MWTWDFARLHIKYNPVDLCVYLTKIIFATTHIYSVASYLLERNLRWFIPRTPDGSTDGPRSSGNLEELDFRNEALNALRMEELLKESLGESSLEKKLGKRGQDLESTDLQPMFKLSKSCPQDKTWKKEHGLDICGLCIVKLKVKTHVNVFGHAIDMFCRWCWNVTDAYFQNCRSHNGFEDVRSAIMTKKFKICLEWMDR